MIGHRLESSIKDSVRSGISRLLGSRKEIEEFWAVKDVSFEIKQGEAVGIVGRNGAGKSTLLKLLSRITHPTTGQIELNGRVSSLLEVGTGFHPELTGRENIFLNGTILGMTRSEIKSKFDEIVDFSSVEKFLDTPVKHYSSGMYVRLAFSVAAHLEPEILIIDEVLAVGDAEFQKKCLGKMEDVTSAGRTVIFVSHNLESIQNLCQRAILIESGSLVAFHETKTILEMYLEKDSIGIFNQLSIQGRNHVRSIQLLSLDSMGSINIFDELELEFQVVIENPIKNAALSYQIRNLSGKNVIHNLIVASEQEFGHNKGIYLLRNTISKLNLYPGSYTCSVFFADASSKQHFDKLENVVSFKVLKPNTPREFYWQDNSAIYYQENNWIISND